MNTVAKLFIDRQERELIYTNIDYHRDAWANGKPCTETMGGMVAVGFIPRGDEDEILRWMFADRMDDDSVEYPRCLYVLKKAEIVFYEGDYDGRILFKYKLEDCTCVYYQESFSNLWGMETTLILSAAIQYYKNNDTFLIKGWRENWKPPQPYQTPVEEFEDTTPKVIDFFITNKDGIRKENFKIGEFIHLKIESKNKIGDVIDIRLNRKDKNFEYKGNLLPNDTLKDYTIQSDSDTIKLKVVKP